MIIYSSAYRKCAQNAKTYHAVRHDATKRWVPQLNRLDVEYECVRKLDGQDQYGLMLVEFALEEHGGVGCAAFRPAL